VTTFAKEPSTRAANHPERAEKAQELWPREAKPHDLVASLVRTVSFRPFELDVGLRLYLRIRGLPAASLARGRELPFSSFRKPAIDHIKVRGR
jgi:hypothetical protein